MGTQPSPILVLLSCFAIAAMAGLSAVLTSKKPLTLRAVVASTLYSGLSGLTTGLLWYNYAAKDGPYWLIGFCGIVGFLSVSATDFIIKSLTAGGIDIKIQPHNRGDRRNDDNSNADDDL